MPRPFSNSVAGPGASIRIPRPVTPVRVQADALFRARAEDVGQLKVRSSNGEMVPLAAVLRVTPTAGPERAMRYNGFLSADISGRAAPGYSSGEAQAVVERLAAETLPRGIGLEWTELTYQEILAGNSALIVFPIGILLVFLVLAALYESLTLPLSIIMIVPMGLLAAMSGVCGQQYFYPDRAIRPRRPVSQERDPDR